MNINITFYPYAHFSRVRLDVTDKFNTHTRTFMGTVNLFHDYRIDSQNVIFTEYLSSPVVSKEEFLKTIRDMIINIESVDVGICKRRSKKPHL